MPTEDSERREGMQYKEACEGAAVGPKVLDAKSGGSSF